MTHLTDSGKDLVAFIQNIADSDIYTLYGIIAASYDENENKLVLTQKDIKYMINLKRNDPEKLQELQQMLNDAPEQAGHTNQLLRFILESSPDPIEEADAGIEVDVTEGEDPFADDPPEEGDYLNELSAYIENIIDFVISSKEPFNDEVTNAQSKEDVVDARVKQLLKTSTSHPTQEAGRDLISLYIVSKNFPNIQTADEMRKVLLTRYVIR